MTPTTNHMPQLYVHFLCLGLLAMVGCGQNATPNTIRSAAGESIPMNPVESIVERPNELGFAKVKIRMGETYREGILDKEQREIVPPLTQLLVNDISGDMALVQMERKFLFVPLQYGPVSSDDLASVNGFQYAEPYRDDLALVVVNDRWFYINRDGEKAFTEDFDFAESFHHRRALVKRGEQFKIIDTQGDVVAALKYDQVSVQSPWCWQVTNVESGKYRSGFVDLDGNAISELIYDEVGYYDAETKRIRVGRNKLFGFLDEYAQVVIPLQYEYAEIFDRGKARVKLNGRVFYVDRNGNEVPD